MQKSRLSVSNTMIEQVSTYEYGKTCETFHIFMHHFVLLQFIPIL